jgi:hypothetical protein
MKRQEIIESIQNVYNNLARIAQEQLGGMVVPRKVHDAENLFYGVLPDEMVVNMLEAFKVFEDDPCKMIFIDLKSLTGKHFNIEDMERIVRFLKEVGDPDATIWTDGDESQSELRIFLTSEYCFGKFG